MYKVSTCMGQMYNINIDLQCQHMRSLLMISVLGQCEVSFWCQVVLKMSCQSLLSMSGVRRQGSRSHCKAKVQGVVRLVV